MDLAAATLFHDRTPSDLASDYELSLAQVHAALAYYYEHKAEVDQVIREQIAIAKEFKEKRIGSQGNSLLTG
jgi:hypothetical protein